MKRSQLFLVFICLFLVSRAQLEALRYNADGPSLPEWVRLMYAPDPDPGAVEEAYVAYYASHPFVKNGHTQYYKRWKRELGHDQIPLDPQQRADYATTLNVYLRASEELVGSRAANWGCIGPFDWDHGAVAKSYACGAAHVYTVKQSASSPDVIYAGTANSGLWKSVDKGLNWTNLTKSMMVGEVYALEIDRTDANIVYFGAGGDLWKTLDGGSTWNTIGDATFQGLAHAFKEIQVHPTNAQVLYVLSDLGLWRSSNAGSTFTQVQAGAWQELEFKPSDPNTVYAIKQIGNRTEFWRSTNNGSTFAQVGTGWPLPVSPDEQKRTEIAVSAAAPNMVYALCTGDANGGSGLYGVYKSVDQGANWTFQCCGAQPAGVPSPTNFNLMGWDDGGQDDGGQYYYDLAFDVDPSNANKVNVCGVQRWVSTDGGASFTCPAKWSHSNKVDYLHADIHDFRYYGANEVWAANDGGVFYSSDGGATFERRMFGISGTDFWGFGAGGWTGSNVMLGGTYHNGTLLKDNNTYINGWVSTDGGDGYRGFVHPQYDRRALSDYGYKVLSGDRNVNNTNGTWSKQPNASYIVGESSEVAWHPNLVDAAYVGNGTALWLTNDNGLSFSQVHDFGEKVTNIEVAFSDANTIYACTYVDWWGVKRVYRSTDAGGSWTDITPTSAALNGNTWVPYDIAVSAVDPQTIWLVRTSQYGNSPNLNGYVVYKSTSGGSAWTNITDAGLNGEWPTNITHQYGSNGVVYIGTRRAVYTRNDAAPAWSLWNAGLPAKIFSTRLLINYRDGLIRNGTDRSVWESAMEAPAPPVANFAVDRRTVTCLGPTVKFYDNSALSGNGATWAWTFVGGNPATSTVRDPVVTYGAPGTYGVSLTVTDVNGTHTRTVSDQITYLNSTAATPVTADAEDLLIAPAGWSLKNPDDLDTWSNQALTSGADGLPTRAWRMDYYYYNAPGQLDHLVSPLISLAGSAGTRLKFHHAYKPYGANYTDGLRVEISTDCGANWAQLYYAEALALGTTTTGTSPWSPTAAEQWQLHDIDLSAYDGMNVVIRFTGVNDYGDRLYLDNVSITNSGVRLAVKLMLEGPYVTGTLLMRDDLRVAGLLPADEPYTGSGFNRPDGGGERIHDGVLRKEGNPAIVDWVIVELREASAPANIVATRAALLQRNGDVVAVDGVSPISFPVAAGSYHIVVRHRNHLGTMTAAPLMLSTVVSAVDFTSAATYGTGGTKTIGSTHVLWAGDVSKDVAAPSGLKYTGNNNDRDPILQVVGGVTTNTVNGYLSSDVNMDGTAKYTGTGNDRDPILQNIGGVITTNVRVEQLP